MENKERKEKLQKQDVFWKGIIQKYEARNAELENEQIELQCRVDQMDASMPAVMAFNMAKLAKDKPNAEVDNLVQLPCSCPQQPPKEPMKLPDLANVSVFSIEDADINYMDRIKNLTDQEKRLIDEVNKLRSKEKALKDTKKKVDKIMRNGDCDCVPKMNVDGSDLQKMNQKLLEENRNLCDEIADMKLEMKHTRETIEGPVARELDRERRRALQLEIEMQEKCGKSSGHIEAAEREIDFLRSQIDATDKNLRDMIEINNKLKEEINIMNHRMTELQNDLINQKISEANTLAVLKAALDKKPPSGGGPGRGSGGCSCGGLGGPGGGGPGGPGGGGSGGPGGGGGGPGGGGGGPGGGIPDTCECPPCHKNICTGEGELYDIARDLSKELQNIEGDTTIPEDLKGTVEVIKDLCDMIDQNRPPGSETEVEIVDYQEPTQDVPERDTELGEIGDIEAESEPVQSIDPTVRFKSKIIHISEQVFRSSTDLAEEMPVEAPAEEMPVEAPAEEVPVEAPAEEMPVEAPAEEMAAEETAAEATAAEETAAEPAPPVDAKAEPETEAGAEPSGDVDKIPVKEPCVCPSKREIEPSESLGPCDPCVTCTEAGICLEGIAKSAQPTPVRSELEESLGVVSELEVTIDTELTTDIKVVKKCTDGFNVTTTVTRSGCLEVTTEGPEGIIETTMTVTPSGNVEIVTEFAESTSGTQPEGLAEPGQGDKSDGQLRVCRRCSDFPKAADLGDPGGSSFVASGGGSKPSAYEADDEASYQMGPEPSEYVEEPLASIILDESMEQPQSVGHETEEPSVEGMEESSVRSHETEEPSVGGMEVPSSVKSHETEEPSVAGEPFEEVAGREQDEGALGAGEYECPVVPSSVSSHETEEPSVAEEPFEEVAGREQDEGALGAGEYECPPEPYDEEFSTSEATESIEPSSILEDTAGKGAGDAEQSAGESAESVTEDVEEMSVDRDIDAGSGAVAEGAGSIGPGSAGESTYDGKAQSELDGQESVAASLPEMEEAEASGESTHESDEEPSENASPLGVEEGSAEGAEKESIYEGQVPVEAASVEEGSVPSVPSRESEKDVGAEETLEEPLIVEEVSIDLMAVGDAEPEESIEGSGRLEEDEKKPATDELIEKELEEVCREVPGYVCVEEPVAGKYCAEGSQIWKKPSLVDVAVDTGVDLCRPCMCIGAFDDLNVAQDLADAQENLRASMETSQKRLSATLQQVLGMDRGSKASSLLSFSEAIVEEDEPSDLDDVPPAAIEKPAVEEGETFDAILMGKDMPDEVVEEVVDEDWLEGGIEKDTSAGAADKDASVGGADKDGSEGSVDKDGSEGGVDKDGSKGGVDKDGSERGEDKDGSEGGVDKDGSGGGVGIDGSVAAADKDASEEGVDIDASEAGGEYGQSGFPEDEDKSEKTEKSEGKASGASGASGTSGPSEVTNTESGHSFDGKEKEDEDVWEDAIEDIPIGDTVTEPTSESARSEKSQISGSAGTPSDITGISKRSSKTIEVPKTPSTLTPTSKRSSRTSVSPMGYSCKELPPCDCGTHSTDCACLDCLTKPCKEEISSIPSDLSRICDCISAKVCGCVGPCDCEECDFLKPVGMSGKVCGCVGPCDCEECDFLKDSPSTDIPCDCEVCMCRDCIDLEHACIDLDRESSLHDGDAKPSEERSDDGSNKPFKCDESEKLYTCTASSESMVTAGEGVKSSSKDGTSEKSDDLVCDCTNCCVCEECQFLRRDEQSAKKKATTRKYDDQEEDSEGDRVCDCTETCQCEKCRFPRPDEVPSKKKSSTCRDSKQKKDDTKSNEEEKRSSRGSSNTKSKQSSKQSSKASLRASKQGTTERAKSGEEDKSRDSKVKEMGVCTCEDRQKKSKPSSKASLSSGKQRHSISEGVKTSEEMKMVSKGSFSKLDRFKELEEKSSGERVSIYRDDTRTSGGGKGKEFVDDVCICGADFRTKAKATSNASVSKSEKKRQTKELAQGICNCEEYEAAMTQDSLKKPVEADYSVFEVESPWPRDCTKYSNGKGKELGDDVCICGTDFRTKAEATSKASVSKSEKIRQTKELAQGICNCEEYEAAMKQDSLKKPFEADYGVFKEESPSPRDCTKYSNTKGEELGDGVCICGADFRTKAKATSNASVSKSEKIRQTKELAPVGEEYEAEMKQDSLKKPVEADYGVFEDEFPCPRDCTKYSNKNGKELGDDVCICDADFRTKAKATSNASVSKSEKIRQTKELAPVGEEYEAEMKQDSLKKPVEADYGVFEDEFPCPRDCTKYSNKKGKELGDDVCICDADFRMKAKATSNASVSEPEKIRQTKELAEGICNCEEQDSLKKTVEVDYGVFEEESPCPRDSTKYSNKNSHDAKIPYNTGKTKDMEEIQHLMNQIKCACKEAEAVSGPTLTKQASEYSATLSSLQLALDAFQQKCKVKDQMIESMQEEIKQRAKGNTFEDLIADMERVKDDVEDYDRSALADALPKPLDPNLTKFGRLPMPCICEMDDPQSDVVCECLVDPSPLEIVDIRRIGPNSILMKWICSKSDQVIGYEICVNDVLKSRVLSRTRNSTIVDGLVLKTSINIAIYAVSYNGRCYPSARAIYEM